MTFNKAKAEKQWLKWKETEEEKLRQLGMDERINKKTSADGLGRFQGGTQILGTFQ